MKDNKNSIYMILGAIVIVLVMVASFILGTKYANKEDKETNETDNNEVATITQEEEDYLVSMMPAYMRGYGYNIYQNKLITVDDLSSEQLSLSVYYELKSNHYDDIVASMGSFEGEIYADDYQNEDDYILAYKQKCIESGNLYFGELLCYVINNEEEKGWGWDAYSAETVEKIYYTFYGENYNYEAPEEIGNSAAGCSYQDGYYFCEEGGGFGPGGEYYYKVVINSEKKNNEIYIYEKYIYIDEICDSDYENCTDYIYTDYTKTTKLGKMNSEEDMYDTFIENATTYKHTYKQNSNGTYYWYSVEPVTE